MSLNNRAALWVGGNWVHLPPFDLEIKSRELRASFFYDVPFSGQRCPYSRRHGFEIRVSGMYVFDTVEEGRTFQRALRESLSSAAGVARPCEIALWTGGAYIDQHEVYRSCIVSEDGIEFGNEPGGTDAARSYAFTLRSMDPMIYGTNSAGGSVTAGDYEDYIYGGSGGGGSVSYTHSFKITFHFAGLVSTTTSDNAAIMQKVATIPTDITTTWNLAHVKVTGCGSVINNGTSTTFRVGTAPYNFLGGSYVAASVADGAGVGNEADGSGVTFSPGDAVYGYCSSGAAGHQDVTVEATFVAA